MDEDGKEEEGDPHQRQQEVGAGCSLEDREIWGEEELVTGGNLQHTRS